jgi:hypothetical protein
MIASNQAAHRSGLRLGAWSKLNIVPRRRRGEPNRLWEWRTRMRFALSNLAIPPPEVAVVANAAGDGPRCGLTSVEAAGGSHNTPLA